MQNVAQIGTGNAVLHMQVSRRCLLHFTRWEELIRPWNVSLIAVAAIAASILLTREREESDTTGVPPAGENQPARLKLDAIRAAGL